ncbi:unnamed protein product [Arabis nemorensis]|uniref:Uncharacterized protein n=1 Tax=Arabis nemorensis TaxID=586526 RepID=A0A565BJ41_9BRAS|nr:unnamed protein product [Arabis nemorensis]
MSEARVHVPTKAWFLLSQHDSDGGEDDAIAAAHGASSNGEHVTASTTRIWTTVAKRIAARAKTETHITFTVTREV